MPISLFQSRDRDILMALERGPLTSRQLLALSVTFAQPFPHERLVRRRLQQLTESGLARQATYVALPEEGPQNYYQLGPLGHRLLYGPDAPPPARRTGAPIAASHQQHAFALMQFVVRLCVAAHQTGLTVAGYHAENRVQLSDGQDTVYPDCAFQLVAADGRTFSYFVELDNRTERIASPQDVDSWQRKLRIYEAVQSQTPVRFRVLAVCTGSPRRVAHILELAAQSAANPRRSLVYAASLSEFLAAESPLLEPLFRDHRGQPVSLFPSHLAATSLPQERSSSVA